MHLTSQIPLATPVWLDCDPGNDDAYAILLTACHPSFNLVGISTVHGNVLLAKTTHNALALLDVLNFSQDDIKVYAGESVPLAIEPLHAEDVHGSSGMGGATLPEHPSVKLSEDMSYLDAMKHAVDSYPNEICIICTGALTNLAMLLDKYPDITSKVKLVSIMGGAINIGNITPYSEFNIRIDPHAAKRVFAEPTLANKVLLVPLNITHTVLALEPIRTAIYNPDGENKSPLRRLFHRIISFYSATYLKKYNNNAGPPVHDPLAAFLTLPMIAQGKPQFAEFVRSCDLHYLQRELEVTTEGEHIGRTSIASANMDPLRVEKGGVYIALHINSEMFWSFMLRALELADEQVNAS